ncbi:hypothetical protein LIA77_11256 [Sarocladium implicatum]|nr:hypothetical protein LIA77_11256 [Sarocladium implicatum]
MASPCVNIGDGDVYGLGVRLGLYLLWASGFIVRLLGSWPRVSAVRTTNNILCGALALAEFVRLIDGSALSVDYLLSYYLTIVLFYSESYNLVREENTTRNPQLPANEVEVYKLFPDLPLIFQNLLFASYTLVGAWFWQVGIRNTTALACDYERAAVIVVFDLHSASWVTAATIMAAILGAIFTLILLMHLKSLKQGVMSGPELVFFRAFLMVSSTQSRELNDWILVGILRPKPPTPRTWSVTGLLSFAGRAAHFAAVNLLGPFVAIVSVERMIQANRLETPSIRESTGQMIALVTGTSSFILALWELYLDIIKRFRPQEQTPPEPQALSQSYRAGAPSALGFSLWELGSLFFSLFKPRQGQPWSLSEVYGTVLEILRPNQEETIDSSSESAVVTTPTPVPTTNPSRFPPQTLRSSTV